MQKTKYKMQDTIKIYTQPAFVICVAVLTLAASGMAIVIKSFGIYLKKEPLPLKKSLDLLDQNSLAPYQVVARDKIENQQVLKELGTKDYIQWVLEDTQVPADSPVRQCSLFITYYELPDRVPHIPDECYVGVGHQRLTSDGVVFKVNRDGGLEKFKGKCVVFFDKNTTRAQLSENTKFPVLYLFNVNGVYAGSREQARFTLNKNIRGKYSYFSKVEWKFFNIGLGSKIYPDEQEAIAASGKLLSVILPALEGEHWPEDF